MHSEIMISMWYFASIIHTKLRSVSDMWHYRALMCQPDSWLRPMTSWSSCWLPGNLTVTARVQEAAKQLLAEHDE